MHKKMKLFSSLFGLLAVFFSSWCSAAVYEQELNNGLRILVQTDHRAPVVVSQLWYHIGAADEVSGNTGISHVLEHMMFKGTKKYGPNQFSKIIAAKGGKENAMTGRDFTMYFEILANNRLETSFKLEADRMRNLNLLDKEFKKELAVVKEERHMRTDDNPIALTYERFNAQAHPIGPYHNPPIGWPKDLKNMKVGDLKQWYKTWYSPNNATLVVVGDVAPDAVFQLAKKYFGDIPASKLPKRQLDPFLKAPGERHITVRVPAKLPFLFIGYNVPSVATSKDTKDAYALLVAASILSGGDSARLPRLLLRKQHLVNSVDADYSLYTKYSGLFTLQAVPTPKHTLPEVKNALLDQIKLLQTMPVTEEELKRVQMQMVAENIFSRDSLFGKAMFLGRLISVGLPWQESVTYTEKIKAVTSDDVQRVAKKYLTANHMTVAFLEPLPLKAAKDKKEGVKNAH